MTHQVTGYDLTLSATPELDTPFVLNFLNDWAKKWTFQLEEDRTTGYRHYHIRLSLMVKRRLSEIIAQTNELWPSGTSVKWSVTSASVHSGQNFNYVLNADTRVDGPWTDKDYEAPPPETRQLKEFRKHQLYHWQTVVEELCTKQDDRWINVVLDVHGYSGKSIFAEHLEYKGLAYEIPFMRSIEKIMQCVMSIKPKKAYLIDLPHGMKKDKMGDLFYGIECLKNGVAYDKMLRKRRFDPPQVIVFTNVVPDFGLLSLDRWKIWKLDENKYLTDQTQSYISQWRAKIANLPSKKRLRADAESRECKQKSTTYYN
jgi:hypothetical protein